MGCGDISDGTTGIDKCLMSPGMLRDGGTGDKAGGTLVGDTGWVTTQVLEWAKLVPWEQLASLEHHQTLTVHPEQNPHLFVISENSVDGYAMTSLIIAPISRPIHWMRDSREPQASSYE